MVTRFALQVQSDDDDLGHQQVPANMLSGLNATRHPVSKAARPAPASQSNSVRLTATLLSITASAIPIVLLQLSSYDIVLTIAALTIVITTSVVSCIVVTPHHHHDQ